jgi:hypothetical protein
MTQNGVGMMVTELNTSREANKTTSPKRIARIAGVLYP